MMGCEAHMDKQEPAPLELWCLYRNYLEHEDDLIHQRLNWMLVLQGFFFAAFASNHSSPLCNIIPILGYLIALLSLLGVHVARQAIERLEAKWNEQQCCSYFPKITGGGTLHVKELDSPLPYGIPIVLCLGWTFLGMTQHRPASELMHWRSWHWWILAFLPLLPPTLLLLWFAFVRILRKLWKGRKWLDKLRLPKSGTNGVPSIRHVRGNLMTQMRNSWEEFCSYLEEG
jgi:hypothetical protein